MPQRKRGERILGPYKWRDQWGIIAINAAGERLTQIFATRAQACRAKEVGEKEIIERTARSVGEAIDEYELYLREDRENKRKSWKETIRRMHRFFFEVDLALPALDTKRCEAYYKRLTTQLATDSHRNILAEAKSFLRWCVEQKWIPANPAEAIKGKGRRKHGKEQLTVDEARLWLACAIKYAERGEEGAIAAMQSLLMAMRASEIIGQDVRDIDDNGRLTSIRHGKTAAAARRLEIPEILQPYILKVARAPRKLEKRQLRRGMVQQETRLPHEPLYLGRYHTGTRYINGARRERAWVRKWVQKICLEAGVRVVTAHGMRGTHASIAASRGVTGAVVAGALGHEDQATTLRSYARKDAVEGAVQTKALQLLEGGKK